VAGTGGTHIYPDGGSAGTEKAASFEIPVGGR